jgi:hypothetical protein
MEKKFVSDERARFFEPMVTGVEELSFKKIVLKCYKKKLEIM